ncbi:MAG TPA: hypothetical protein VMW17_19860 [Candidatus Binatia bacterium]|nr:hypothetical protein [Candidatus Binatia bacterium]
MRTVKRNPFLAGAAAILGGLLLVTNIASAELGSDKSAAIIIFPQLVSDTRMGTATPVDTLIQVQNTSSHQIAARCFLVNANSHCSNAGFMGVPLVCDIDSDCNPGAVTGGHCIAGWQETDFRFQLTPHQPISWVLSEGMSVFPIDGLIKIGPVDPDTGLPASNNQEPFGTSSIPPAPEQPFRGELKCVQVDPTTLTPDTGTEIPDDGTNTVNNKVGDLAGVATIVEPKATDLDARAYNAIGLQATPNAAGGDNTLVLGGSDPDAAEYDGCPGVLLLDHFFDGATDPVSGATITTKLTLVPCSENFLTQQTGKTTIQYLVYNEFEQRFSTSNSANCYKNSTLSDIASRPGPDDDATSIFNVNVQGTLSGQTRIRPVDSGVAGRGDGLLGVAEEYFANNGKTRSDAFNISKPNISGRAVPDIIVLP